MDITIYAAMLEFIITQVYVHSIQCTCIAVQVHYCTCAKMKDPLHVEEHTQYYSNTRAL